MDERREYFRIEDDVVLDWRVLEPQEVDDLVQRIHSGVPDRFTAASSFAATSRQIAQALYKIQTDSPELGRCLQAIDQKMNALAQLYVSENMHLSERPTQRVNLSAGGVAFRVEQPVDVDTLLELRIVVLPDMVGVLSVGRVISCERGADSDPARPWLLHVSYHHLRESDRELLVRHIMNLETERLRAERESSRP